MTLTQECLYDEARVRLLSARPALRLPDRPDGLAALLAARHRETTADHADTGTAQVLAVLHRFDAAAWIRGTCAFVLGLAAERRTAWRRSFTRTIFLAGNPDNLRSRVSFDHIADDSSAAWYGPAPAHATTGTRRLLKLVRGTAPVPGRAPEPVVIPGRRHGSATHRDLYVATAGVRLPQALVHLNHLLAEAVLDGLIAEGDRLTLRRVPQLSGVREEFAALRVDVDPADADRLHAFAGLTKETADVRT